MAWEGVDSRWEGEGGEPAGSVVDAALVADGTSVATFGAEVTQRALDGGVAEIDFEPKLWWKRKPRAVAPEDARAQIKAVAKVLQAKAKEQVENPKPKAQRISEAREAVKPVVSQMPAFDWKPIYDEAYSLALTLAIKAALEEQAMQAAVAEIDRIRRLRDEEDALILALI